MSKIYKHAERDLAIKQPKIQPLSLIYTGLVEDIEKRGEEPELKTGIKELDDILWGIHKKQVLCIAGRPSNGKSVLGVQIAWNLADAGHTTYFISLEMSREQLLERLLCNVMSINNMDLRQGKITEEIREKMKVFEGLLRGHKPKLLITDDIGYNYKDIDATIRRLQPRPEVIVLDYIQLCTLGRFNSKVDAITEYIRALKQLANELDIAVIVMSQMNRGLKDRTDKRPKIEELKGAGSLEEVSDSVAILFWPFKNETECIDASEYLVNVVKQRHSSTGVVTLKFLPQFSRMESGGNSNAGFPY